MRNPPNQHAKYKLWESPPAVAPGIRAMARLRHSAAGVVLAMFGALLLASCDTSSSGSGEGDGDPTVAFSEPTSGAELRTTEAALDIPVIIQTTGLADSDKVQMFLDEAAVGFASAGGAFTYADVTVGKHTLRAKVVDSIGTAYPGSAAQAAIQITVLTVECEADAECDDSDPCTDDSCEQGLCVNEERANCTAECKTAADCANSNAAPDQCHKWECIGEACVLSDDDGATCNDSSECTENDVCAAGTCGGTDITCDDDNECTNDGCNPDSGCSYVDNSADCDDGDACTSGDVCNEGTCSGGPTSCEDGVACTADSCDPETGCVNVPSDAACDDGDVCTDDTCTGGGCENPTNTAACDDGDACTENDTCNNGNCEGEALTFDDAEDLCVSVGCDPITGPFSNPVVCDDGNACTTDSCDPATGCVYSAEVDCDDGNVCTADSCDATTGACVNAAAADGTACDDGNPCSTDDQCTAGVCVGEGPDCDDGNPCTTDACDEVAGCTNTFNTIACDDGNACTEGDACAEGECVAGALIDVDDNNPCTDDTCDSSTGAVHTPNDASCDDGSACTTGDQCSDGTCVGANLDCDDGNECTDDTCNAATGCAHANNSAPCSDDNLCTVDDQCSGGACVPGDSLNADDGNPCTDDSCDPLMGAVHTNNSSSCDDGNACTTGDTCSGGTCAAGATIDCDDGNPCTTDTCSSSSGCVFTPNTAACDDGDDCTTGDQCSAGACVPGANTCQCESDAECAPFEDGNLCNGTLVCVGNQCVVDPATEIHCNDAVVNCMTQVCSPASGTCGPANAPNGTACNDGDSCTTGDQCNAGTCAGTAASCDDNDPCTDDSCNSATGCVHAPVDALTCDDGNPCTDDSCETGVGCVSAPTSGAPCSDGDVCTLDEQCDNGTCTPQGPPCSDGDACTEDVCVAGIGCANPPQAASFCDDGNPCTDDACDSNDGCVSTPNAAACDDGNSCTVNDACAGGSCVGGTPLNVSDGNPCTDDTCNPADGAVHTNNSSPCDDGDACTTNDVCSGGACSGSSIDCDDANPCTDDYCDAAGCQHDGISGMPCDDGDSCTDVDSCSAGECVGTGVAAECQVPGSICTIWGNVGEVVTCPIQLARATQGTQMPAALTVSLQYPANALQPIQFQDQDCSGPSCQIKAVPPAPLWPSGHTLAPTPGVTALWAGTGTAVITHPTNPAAALSTAYLDAGSALVGDSQIVELELVLVANIDSALPVAVNVTSAVATSALGVPMAVSQDLNLLVASNDLPDCTLYAEQCDDGVACTVDACNATTKTCTNTPTAAMCDDAVACTTDTCDPATGCVHIANDSACTDGDVCTQDLCDETTGCIFPAMANGAPCTDGDACTSGDACQAGSCVPGSPVDCTDGNPCTIDQCKASTGCTYPPQNGAPCDDGNTCTSGDYCSAGQCQPGNPVGGPGCGGGGFPICQFFGTAGDEVECLVSLTACDNLVPKATALQFTMLWNATRATIVNFYDELCFPVGCFPVPVTGLNSQPLSTGHAMSIAPNPVGGWNGIPCKTPLDCGGGACTAGYCEGTEAQGGFGAAVLVNLSNPSKTFNNTYIDETGNVVGDSLLLKGKFKLTVDVPESDPVLVKMGELLATDGTSLALTTEVMGLSIVTCDLKE